MSIYDFGKWAFLPSNLYMRRLLYFKGSSNLFFCLVSPFFVGAPECNVPLQIQNGRWDFARLRFVRFPALSHGAALNDTSWKALRAFPIKIIFTPTFLPPLLYAPKSAIESFLCPLPNPLPTPFPLRRFPFSEPLRRQRAPIPPQDSRRVRIREFPLPENVPVPHHPRARPPSIV